MKLRELNPILDDNADIIVIVDDGCNEWLYDLSGEDKVQFFDTNGNLTVDFITWDDKYKYDFKIYVSKEAIK